MNKIEKSTLIKNVLIIIISLLFIISLLPIFEVGKFDHPFGDDYAFGRYTHDAILAGESIFGAIFKTIKTYYNGWQGTFTGVAMMTLTPHIFSESLYFITPIFMIAMLIFSTFALLNTFLNKKYGVKKCDVLLISILMLFLSIQFVPDPLQTFFWWNGSVLYTFFYCLVLLFVERLITLDMSNGKKKLIVFLETLVLGIFIGGGNYVSALLCVLLSLMYLAYKLIFNRNKLLYFIIISMCTIMSLTISVLAPGNAVRQAEEVKNTMFNAINDSIFYAATDIERFTTSFLIISIILIIPLFYEITKKINFSFKYPLICMISSFLIFAAQNSPHFYAASNEGPTRIRNIIYYSYIWLIFINEFYFVGWLSKKINIKKESILKKYIMILPLLIILGFACSGSFSETTLNTCIVALKSGEVQQYDVEIKERIKLYEDPNNLDVVCNSLSVRPKLLILFDISSNENEFSNIAIKNYYGKNSIVCN